ncbi:Z1 domain-containing protein [Arthrobacter koreensis]|uniref:Z1 domain-containing protein n=1 Tax=Arthrobacter koreensis TaxID=199136 RepID=UPI00363AD882
MDSAIESQLRYENQIREVADHLETLVRGGLSISAAIAKSSSGLFVLPKELLTAGRAEYERRRNIIQVWDDDEGTGVIEGESLGSWYGGPKENDVFWSALRNRLKNELPDAFSDVDKSSSRIVGLGKPPGSESIDTRGLVLGYVQSGKTTNFMSVIAKAADVGYRLIIVLSGITDNLRQQTQERLHDYLVEPCQTKVHLLTTNDRDFSEVTSSEALLSQDEMRLLAVVKKNPARLRRLNKWIKKASTTTLANCPILIVDDEADQASIDVGTKRQSTINALVRELLSHPKAAYIAYTATPFANLLIDPTDGADLYPRDFVVSLPRSEAYFGPERVFGSLDAEEGQEPDDGLDVVRIIPDEDAAVVKPPTKKDQLEQWEAAIPPSLREAILWFLMATTARRLRTDDVRHSSMLVHTSMRAAAHGMTREAIDTEISELTRLVQDRDAALLKEMETLWATQTGRVDALSFQNEPIDFHKVLTGLEQTIQQTRVIMDNYLSSERLKYRKETAETVIVIGGNTLSRGLTLEGLISSYFVRAASAYDTLLQMGRWFGYRKGYEDLVRIWMTDELRRWFLDLSIVEAEVREEIEAYAKEGKTPAQLPVRIRSHPQMTITAAAKMRNAVKANVSYSGTKVQTILFNEIDKEWLDANIKAVEKLVLTAHAEGHEENELHSKSVRGFAGVSNDIILRFLVDYNVHEDARTINTDAVSEYIRLQADKGGIESWNIVFIERKNSMPSDMSLGLKEPLRLLRRRKMAKGSKPGVANLKAVSSRWDRFADLSYSKEAIIETFDLSSEKKVRDHHLRKLRKDRGLEKVGVLAIYPINKSSRTDKDEHQSLPQPENSQDPSDTEQNSEREHLDAPSHLIGIALMFPEAKNVADTVDYYSANVSIDEVEDIEAELAAADERDEKMASQEEADVK